LNSPDDKLRVDPIWDYKHGRRTQIIVVNKSEGELFTSHKDTMTRDYIKLKLSDADIMLLIQKLQKIVSTPEPIRTELQKNYLRVVKDEV
jgi:hypothetical protein